MDGPASDCSPLSKSKERMVCVRIGTVAGKRKLWNDSGLAAALALGFLCAALPSLEAQSSSAQTPSTQTQAPQSIPDAPSTVQPPASTPEPPPSPIPRPEEKKPVERDPWTNQPINKPASPEPATQPGE